MEEQFLYYQSPLGPIRISEHGGMINSICFADAIQEDERPTTNPGPLLVRCIEQLIRYFNGELRQFDLPINQPGTDFQKDVWNALCVIPYGRTISYIDLARKMGDNKATRAVAAANGKNQVCIVIPCHRVIGRNGDLVGYAGGLKRKKWLLELEAKYAFGVQTLF